MCVFIMHVDVVFCGLKKVFCTITQYSYSSNIGCFNSPCSKTRAKRKAKLRFAIDEPIAQLFSGARLSSMYAYFDTSSEEALLVAGYCY